MFNKITQSNVSLRNAKRRTVNQAKLLAILSLACHLHPAYAWFWIDFGWSGLARHILALLMVIGAGILLTLYKYNRNRFQNPATYFNHCRFWLIVTVLIPLLYWVLASDQSDQRLFLMLAVWTFFMLATTLGLAIYQNPSNKGIGGIVLFFVDVVAVILVCLYLALPAVSLPILCTLAIVVIFVAFVLTLRLSSLNTLKKIAKESLFIISFCLDVLWLFLVVGTIIFFI
jgi:hypothetical protein